MQLFSRHVSKEIAEVIWEQRDHFMNNGRPRSQKMTVTVFFSDLKGFTTMSEKMDPQELIDWLNTYMEAMTRAIMDHGGVIDDYAGDGIKANFGVPLPRKNDDEVRMDAVNAISCAMAIEQELHRLNDVWNRKGRPAMGTRVGIFTGSVVTGLLGSSDRLKYTTVGDTVNVAARLESYDKEVGKDAVCRILIGDTTLRYLDNRFRTESIGEVSLKGKEEKISVHRVLCEETTGIQPTLQEATND
jgi:adenylate cyclase